MSSDKKQLNPGIRRTVKLFNDLGFITVDSGDGEAHEFDCDRECGYVVIRAEWGMLVTTAKSLALALRARGVALAAVGKVGATTIQASYDPVDDSAIIDINNITDKIMGFGDE